MNEKAEDQRRACVTVGMKVNLGNYESADASLCLSGIEPGMSEAEISELLDTATVSFKLIKTRLLRHVAELREDANGRP